MTKRKQHDKKKGKQMARRDTTLVAQIQAPWWDAGEVCLIREVVTHGDRKAMIKNMIQARMEQGSNAEGVPQQAMDLNFRIEEVQAAMILTMTRDWTLRDVHGKKLPLSLTSIEALADEDVEFICGEIDKRNPQGLTPERRMAFLAQSAASTSEKPTA